MQTTKKVIYDYWLWEHNLLNVIISITWMIYIQVKSHQYHDISNHQQLNCLFNSLLRLTTHKTSQLRINGRLQGESIGDCGFPTQGVSGEENISILWRHHDRVKPTLIPGTPCRPGGPVSPMGP